MARALALVLLTSLGGAVSASDGPAALYRGPIGDYQVAVLSGPGGFVTGPRRLTVLVELREPQARRELRIDLRLEHAGQVRWVPLEAAASPLVYSAEFRSLRAGVWRFTLVVQSGSWAGTARFSIRLFRPLDVAALLAGLAALSMAAVSLLAFRPERFGTPGPGVVR